jgi:hypothetical protein
MIHGDISPQYQRYGEKILVGSDLRQFAFQINHLPARAVYPYPIQGVRM